MGSIITTIQEKTVQGLSTLFSHIEKPGAILVNETRREFEGDFTVVLFPLIKKVKRNPQELGQALGEWMVNETAEVVSFNLVKGFLNLKLDDTFWIHYLLEANNSEVGRVSGAKNNTVLVEYSSPNTNKPLHLGHMRNILLGWSVSRIIEANGFEVFRTQIVNDRGIAICKSMLAWQKFADGATPESTGTKGDHFVGEYYVRFEKVFQAEYKDWKDSEVAKTVYQEQSKGDETEESFFKRFKNQYFNEFSQLGKEARDMLLKWEAGDQEVRKLWQTMNNWVYQGFDKTYQQLGVGFDKSYYESETYLQGRQIVLEGLDKGVFYSKEDSSVWVDLEEAGMDQKLVLRSDGTAVYITQDIGTAQLRYNDTSASRMIYVVADEQNYHFKALFEIMKKLGEPYAEGLHHLSYGMIDLPEGKMKSREGTVVDADDLMAEVIREAREAATERGEIADLSNSDQDQIIKAVAMAALKYFILKVNPRKRMVFNPRESLDLQGQTGPYIQYAYVRISGVQRKSKDLNLPKFDQSETYTLAAAERELIRLLYTYKETLQQAGEEFDPSLLAHYCYELARAFNKFWHDLSILNDPDKQTVAFRLELCAHTGNVLQHGMDLLGIDMPERM